jgi:allantoicase
VRPAFLELVDLASDRLGAVVVSANDEFFASKDNLIKSAPPAWHEGEYTDRGKWMDGWETRRRRDVTPDLHDWCIIRLGAPGIVRGVDVETTYFKGNHPAECAIDLGDGTVWHAALARTPLQGDGHNLFDIQDAVAATHLRLRIYPDGGIARLRAHGEVVADWERLRGRGDLDLAAAELGGLVVACSDMFFGSRHNLIMPGDAIHMADGWETRRRRGPGHDWTVIRLATAGTIRRIEIDTRHFKGNAPASCGLEGAVSSRAAGGAALDREATREPGGASVLRVGVGPHASNREDTREPSGASVLRVGVGPHASEDDDARDGVAAALDALEWRELLPRTPIEAHARQVFEDQVRAIGDITHVRFNIYPDGGVGRLRLFGRPCASKS